MSFRGWLHGFVPSSSQGTVNINHFAAIFPQRKAGLRSSLAIFPKLHQSTAVESHENGGNFDVPPTMAGFASMASTSDHHHLKMVSGKPPWMPWKRCGWAGDGVAGVGPRRRRHHRSHPSRTNRPHCRLPRNPPRGWRRLHPCPGPNRNSPPRTKIEGNKNWRWKKCWTLQIFLFFWWQRWQNNLRTIHYMSFTSLHARSMMGNLFIPAIDAPTAKKHEFRSEGRPEVPTDSAAIVYPGSPGRPLLSDK